MRVEQVKYPPAPATKIEEVADQVLDAHELDGVHLDPSKPVPPEILEEIRTKLDETSK
jgi:hypothetical protein